VKPPAGLDAIATRFDRMSLRERLLVFAALLTAAIVLWQGMLMEPLALREKTLSLELTDLQESVAQLSHATESVASSDPTSVAEHRLEDRQKALDAINAKLAAESAGLIPPSQMVTVIHDVLRHQQGLTLISLKNLPVRSLVPEKNEKPTQAANSAESAASAPPGSAETDAAATPDVAQAPIPATSGPYLHPVELVIEGRYLDIITYLHALEGLKWHFYWRVLELQTKQYPLNRVRIELSTVSLDKEWIGV
jgi:MSHA biogenesis protein MshJ